MRTTLCMDRTTAAHGLDILCDALEEREKDFQIYGISRPGDSDDDAECPIFDSFYENGGSEAIMKMTHFSPIEYDSSGAASMIA